MPAHRAHPRAGFADHAPQQQHVGDLTDGGHGVGVLGQAHSPADDRALRRHQHRGDPLKLREFDAGGVHHGVQADLQSPAAVPVESGTMVVDERPVDNAAGDPLLGLQQQPA